MRISEVLECILSAPLPVRVRVSLSLAAVLGEVCISLISLLVTATGVHQTSIAMLLHSWSPPPLRQIYLVASPRDVCPSAVHLSAATRQDGGIPCPRISLANKLQ